MLCQHCHKKTATVHLTEIENNVKKEIHLCESCAKEKGVHFKQKTSLSELINGLMQSPAVENLQKLSKVTCPLCGMSLLEFHQKGRFGCPNDYTVFSKSLIPLLERIHKNAKHIGKVPKHAAEGQAESSQLVKMKLRLKKAIQKEDYEKAIQLRDKIRQLEETKDGHN